MTKAYTTFSPPTNNINTVKWLESSVDLASATATDAIRLYEAVVVQVSGTATSVTLSVERSNTEAFTTYAVVETITGNLATGIAPKVYDEPGAAFWRVRKTTVTGGSANVFIQGKAVS